MKWVQTGFSDNEEFVLSNCAEEEPSSRRAGFASYVKGCCGNTGKAPDLKPEDLGLNSVPPLHLVQTWEDRKTTTPMCSNKLKISTIQGFPRGAVVKNPPANAGDTGSSPGPGSSHMPQSN